MRSQSENTDLDGKATHGRHPDSSISSWPLRHNEIIAPNNHAYVPNPLSWIYPLGRISPHSGPAIRMELEDHYALYSTGARCHPSTT